MCRCFRWLVLGLVLSSLLSYNNSNAQRVKYKTRDVATSLNVPWEMRWGYDGWIWTTERAGRFDRINPETGEKKVLLAEKDCYQLSESGMLGFDFHPDFPHTPYLYVVFTNEDSTTRTDTVLIHVKLYRYRYDAEKDTLVDRTVLFDRIHGGLQHNGSRVTVGPDEKLYISTGETYYAEYLAQEDSSANGKILRLNLDGSIPADNPWPGSPVWSKGHRNPQGLVFGPNGVLYESEHGDYSDDELNIISKGGDGGWPFVKGFCDEEEEQDYCSKHKINEPIYSWTPTKATSGIEYYDKDLFPEWKNSILIATLKDTSVVQVRLDESKQKAKSVQIYPIILSDSKVPAGRLRDFCISPTGRIFISTSNIWSPEWSPDRIFELIRTGVEPNVVTLRSPSPEAIVPQSLLPLVWEDQVGATYDLQVSSDSSFATVVIEDKALTASTKEINLPKEGKYYWRLRAIIDTAIGPWSEPFNFNYYSAGVQGIIPQDLSIEARPNPTKASLTLQVNSPIENKATLEITDILGRTIGPELSTHVRKGITDISLQTKDLQKGIYIIYFKTTDAVRSVRIIKE